MDKINQLRRAPFLMKQLFYLFILKVRLKIGFNDFFLKINETKLQTYKICKLLFEIFGQKNSIIDTN